MPDDILAMIEDIVEDLTISTMMKSNDMPQSVARELALKRLRHVIVACVAKFGD